MFGRIMTLRERKKLGEITHIRLYASSRMSVAKQRCIAHATMAASRCFKPTKAISWA